jgi:hypothetical protein
VLFDDVSEEVVGCAGVSYCDVRVRLYLDTGTGQRQHLHVDAVPVHVRQPVLGEVDELTLPVGRHRALYPHMADRRTLGR